MAHANDNRHPASRWLMVPGCLLPVVIGLALFSSSGRDDVYISYWPAHTLATQGEILNYNGERVEQSSSLIHVLLLAAIHKWSGLPLVSIGPVLSAVFAVLTVLAAHRLAARVNPAIALPTAVLTGSAACLTYWTFSGMETTLAAFLGIVLIVALAGGLSSPLTPARLILAAVCILAYLSVRPEAVLVTTCMLLGTAALLLIRARTIPLESRSHNRTALQRAAVLLTLVLMLAGGLMLARHAYFGSWFPQPVIAKTKHALLDTVPRGVKYLLFHAWTRADCVIWLLIFPAAAAVFFRILRGREYSAAELLAAMFCATYIGFIATSGADWMEAGRFLVPVVAMVVVVVLGMIHRALPRRLFAPVVALLALLEVAAALHLARYYSIGHPLWAVPPVEAADQGLHLPWLEYANRPHYRDRVVAAQLDKTIREIQARRPGTLTILSSQFGLICYYVALSHYGHVRFIDLRGLATRDLTDSPRTARWGRGPVGLNLTYEDYFKIRREAGPSWSPGKIDIIFETSRPDDQGPGLFEANGFAIVYQQDGPMPVASTALHGWDLSAEQFIAVRRDLYDSPPACVTRHFQAQRPGVAR